MGPEKIRIIYKYEPKIEPVDLWIALCSVLKEESLLSETYEIDDDNPKTIGKIEKILRTRRHFGINDQLFSFSFSAPWAGKLQQLIIKLIKCEEGVKINWDLWVKKLSDFGVFVYAWEYDDEFSFWQNNNDIEFCKNCGKPYEHLPTKASGVPLPLAQIIIDTSKNPGREIFKPGYVESVGATMWLGDEFFPLTEANKETVKSTDWLEVSELKPGILKIKAQETCFTQSEGKEADLQNKMRDLLYPNHD